MTIIYISFTALALSIAILLYVSQAHKIFKALALSSLIVLGLGLEAHYRANLGTPIKDYPSGEFIYVHHELQGQTIYLWVYYQDIGHRLYVFPYDQDTAEELKDGQEAQAEGQEQVGRFVQDPRNPDARSLEMDDATLSGSDTGKE